jgi:coenzyme PQQ precursor peptide PqqA
MTTTTKVAWSRPTFTLTPMGFEVTMYLATPETAR